MFVEFETKGGWYVLREEAGGEVLVPRFWKERGAHMTTRIYMPHQTVNFAAKIVGLPPVSMEDSQYIVWEHTGFPCFFRDPIDFERQVLDFMREWKSTGKWPRHPLDALLETATRVE